MNYVKTFESFLNESAPSLGSKTKKFDSSIKEWNYFKDADEGGDESLPKEWHDSLKDLNIKADEAIVVFFDAHGDRQEVLDAAKRCGLKFAEVEGGEDGGSGGIVFSAKQ